MTAEIWTNILLAILALIGGAGLNLLSGLKETVRRVEINTATLGVKVDQHEKTITEDGTDIKNLQKSHA